MNVGPRQSGKEHDDASRLYSFTQIMRTCGWLAFAQEHELTSTRHRLRRRPQPRQLHPWHHPQFATTAATAVRGARGAAAAVAAEVAVVLVMVPPPIAVPPERANARRYQLQGRRRCSKQQPRSDPPRRQTTHYPLHPVP